MARTNTRHRSHQSKLARIRVRNTIAVVALLGLAGLAVAFAVIWLNQPNPKLSVALVHVDGYGNASYSFSSVANPNNRPSSPAGELGKKLIALAAVNSRQQQPANSLGELQPVKGDADFQSRIQSISNTLSQSNQPDLELVYISGQFYAKDSQAYLKMPEQMTGQIDSKLNVVDDVLLKLCPTGDRKAITVVLLDLGDWTWSPFHVDRPENNDFASSLSRQIRDEENWPKNLFVILSNSDYETSLYSKTFGATLFAQAVQEVLTQPSSAWDQELNIEEFHSLVRRKVAAWSVDVDNIPLQVVPDILRRDGNTSQSFPLDRPKSSTDESAGTNPDAEEKKRSVSYKTGQFADAIAKIVAAPDTFKSLYDFESLHFSKTGQPPSVEEKIEGDAREELRQVVTQYRADCLKISIALRVVDHLIANGLVSPGQEFSSEELAAFREIRRMAEVIGNEPDGNELLVDGTLTGKLNLDTRLLQVALEKIVGQANRNLENPAGCSQFVAEQGARFKEVLASLIESPLFQETPKAAAASEAKSVVVNVPEDPRLASNGKIRQERRKAIMLGLQNDTTKRLSDPNQRWRDDLRARMSLALFSADELGKWSGVRIKSPPIKSVIAFDIAPSEYSSVIDLGSTFRFDHVLQLVPNPSPGVRLKFLEVSVEEQSSIPKGAKLEFRQGNGRSTISSESAAIHMNLPDVAKIDFQASYDHVPTEQPSSPSSVLKIVFAGVDSENRPVQSDETRITIRWPAATQIALTCVREKLADIEERAATKRMVQRPSGSGSQATSTDLESNGLLELVPLPNFRSSWTFRFRNIGLDSNQPSRLNGGLVAEVYALPLSKAGRLTPGLPDREWSAQVQQKDFDPATATGFELLARSEPVTFDGNPISFVKSVPNAPASTTEAALPQPPPGSSAAHRANQGLFVVLRERPPIADTALKTDAPTATNPADLAPASLPGPIHWSQLIQLNAMEMNPLELIDQPLADYTKQLEREGDLNSLTSFVGRPRFGVADWMPEDHSADSTPVVAVSDRAFLTDVKNGIFAKFHLVNSELDTARLGLESMSLKEDHTGTKRIASDLRRNTSLWVYYDIAGWPRAKRYHVDNNNIDEFKNDFLGFTLVGVSNNSNVYVEQPKNQFWKPENPNRWFSLDLNSKNEITVAIAGSGKPTAEQPANPDGQANVNSQFPGLGLVLHADFFNKSDWLSYQFDTDNQHRFFHSDRLVDFFATSPAPSNPKAISIWTRAQDHAIQIPGSWISNEKHWVKIYRLPAVNAELDPTDDNLWATIWVYLPDFPDAQPKAPNIIFTDEKGAVVSEVELEKAADVKFTLVQPPATEVPLRSLPVTWNLESDGAKAPLRFTDNNHPKSLEQLVKALGLKPEEILEASKKPVELVFSLTAQNVFGSSEPGKTKVVILPKKEMPKPDVATTTTPKKPKRQSVKFEVERWSPPLSGSFSIKNIKLSNEQREELDLKSSGELNVFEGQNDIKVSWAGKIITVENILPGTYKWKFEVWEDTGTGFGDSINNLGVEVSVTVPSEKPIPLDFARVKKKDPPVK